MWCRHVALPRQPVHLGSRGARISGMYLRRLISDIMKSLLILGAGTAGTMVAHKLRHLVDSGWQITIVDQEPVHYYQPGYLFMPFGIYDKKDVIRPKLDLMPHGVALRFGRIVALDPQARCVELSNGEKLVYDMLLIATGAEVQPDQTPGLGGPEWGRSIHTFYTFAGAAALAPALRDWKGGRLLLNVVENPIKCPVAPLEFLMLADAFFVENGLRDRVELVYATPLSGAFTKPKAAERLGHLLTAKNIKLETDFVLERVDPEAKKIVSYDERELAYDLLVSVPVNMGASFIQAAGLGDELNFVRVDKRTLRAEGHDNIFSLGDAANTPASKAGSVAHFEVEGFAENFVRYIKGGELKPLFDGHANCFVETGHGKGLLIDFNYDTEPLPGTYPLPAIGPFSLLNESRINHWGKLAFRWIYWNVLLKGLPMPVPTQMSMAGKVQA